MVWRICIIFSAASISIAMVFCGIYTRQGESTGMIYGFNVMGEIFY